MRDREAIDAELRRIAAARRSIRERGGQPSYGQADALLDERLGHLPAPESAAGKNTAVATPRRRGRALLRFGPLALLPLSLLAVVAALVVTITWRHFEPAAQPTVVPPSTASPSPAAPKPPAPPVDVVDVAFVAALKHDGVPVPSQEYVAGHGHAVCEFLTRQTDFADAVRFVQQSTIWDADQSANFTAGAIVSYCPQYETTAARPAGQPPGYESTLSDLQNVQGDLQRIEGELQDIRDRLPGALGHQ
ncbi:DUF732 domain-containing protein [Mycobacterium palustre]|uniref:DUF732 domain-containing protein n=1 Tax=Mycobacterium palustre TaxID=153971 RepID=A0A1X1ZMQ5_9MYCO|nr:DUF732 domain-containing protein [Mycobacterium palustre]MCV7101980.1 DUF732 domain-containing protein [Mycobacterium palustre]ORW24592.1 hypothetical protein AWC19_08775 [Mycobacterium palustre]